MAAGSASHTGGLIKASFLKSGKEFTQKYSSRHVYVSIHVLYKIHLTGGGETSFLLFLSFLKSLPTLAGKPVPISAPSHKATLSYSANIGCCSMSNAGRLVLLDWTFSAPSCNWPQCPILVVTAPSDEGESWMVAKKGNKMS